MRILFVHCLLGASLLCALDAAGAEAAQVSAPALAPAPASDDASNRFDGDWTLRIACPAAGDAAAYAVDMPASILNGQLFGSNGAQGLPGVVQVDGVVAPDGLAQLQARGRTDDPALAVGHPPSGTAYAYTVPVRFDAAAGRASGRLDAGRDCHLELARR